MTQQVNPAKEHFVTTGVGETEGLAGLITGGFDTAGLGEGLTELGTGGRTTEETVDKGLGVEIGIGTRQGLGDHTTTGEVLTRVGGDIEGEAEGFGETHEAH